MEKKPLANYVLPTSATMVGVCLTAVGLVKILEQHDGPGHVDEYFSLNSIIFLISNIAAYMALRTKHARRVALYETIADNTFIGGMLVLVVGTLLFAYEFI